MTKTGPTGDLFTSMGRRIESAITWETRRRRGQPFWWWFQVLGEFFWAALAAALTVQFWGEWMTYLFAVTSAIFAIGFAYHISVWIMTNHKPTQVTQ